MIVRVNKAWDHEVSWGDLEGLGAVRGRHLSIVGIAMVAEGDDSAAAVDYEGRVFEYLQLIKALGMDESPAEDLRRHFCADDAK